jgi:hypothetical protein
VEKCLGFVMKRSTWLVMNTSDAKKDMELSLILFGLLVVIWFLR